jgi:NAD(P)H-hydrate epimerase
VDLGSLESMTLPLAQGRDGGLTEPNVGAILEFARGKQVLAVGPGLGTSPSTVQVIRSMVAAAEIPVVLDADGLNAFAGAVEELAETGAEKILTPHPGELARLLAVSTAEIQADRVASARAAARQAKAVVVLKGFQTLVAEPTGAVFVNPTGNPGMASGGTGDVLTGIITGLLSQGLGLSTAACLGAFVHGSAGDRAVVERGQIAVTASDLLTHLPEAFLELQS